MDRLEACKEFVFKEDADFAPVQRSDIVGLDRVLDELDHYIEYLKNFKKVEKYQVELNAGVLFAGQPGTGKTLCARYIATESNAKFIDVEAFSNLYESNTDEDSSEIFVSDLFALAREYVKEKNIPVVLFFDELDYFLCDPDVINDLKQELSGVKGKARGVFVVATTNSPQQIDSSLLRDGRIGEKIYFSPPNRKAKLELLKHYVYKEPHVCSDNIDFDNLSFLLEGSAVPSTIEEIVNKAWRYVCMRAISIGEDPVLTSEMLLRTMLEEIQGVPDNTVLSEEEYRNIAIYNVSRALVGRTLGFPAQLVALPRSGYDNAFRIEDMDQLPYLSIDIHPTVVSVCLSGIVAHKLHGIPRHRNAMADFAKATEYAVVYVEGFVANKKGEDFSGISSRGLYKGRQSIHMPPGFGFSGHSSLKHVEGLIQECEDRAKRIIEYYMREGIVEKLLSELKEKEYLFQKDIDKYVVPKELIEDGLQHPEEDPGQYL